MASLATMDLSQVILAVIPMNGHLLDMVWCLEQMRHDLEMKDCDAPAVAMSHCWIILYSDFHAVTKTNILGASCPLC